MTQVALYKWPAKNIRMKISERVCPSEKGDIKIVRLENESGAYVELSSLGAGIVEVGVPDRAGKIENVALRYADISDYLYDGPNMGKTCGRYANRIAEGKLRIAGEEYQLDLNLPPHHLHGGKEGFANKNWETELLESGVRFICLSTDGDENYPGNLKAAVTYLWSEDNRLTIGFHAETDRETVVNLTNHTYWNLRGADSGEALSHELRMKAARWLPTDRTQIPTGELAPVAGTPMDFTEWKALGKDFGADYEPFHIGKYYDHCWAIDGFERGGMVDDVVELLDPASGRALRISTDQPGVQVYTGNWLTGSAPNMSGRGYEDYEGVAIEMQGFPDAPNRPGFPSQTLRPGESYDRRIILDFAIDAPVDKR